ncbi:retrovirus-related pol polyprotein from transposon TNT 1-94, partial [Tanacetum coccineum]
PSVYSIGPLHTIVRDIEDKDLQSLGSSLWKEEHECLEWLDCQESGSVIYVNFGSITVITPQQLEEFSWGLANSEQKFLWVIRPDLVRVDALVLSAEILEMTRDRGFVASWCPQEKVLDHPSIGGFLTHSGWNSTLESITSGVPMICWPFFAEQQTNCWWCCNQWGIGVEIDSDVNRNQVEKVVRDLMDGKCIDLTTKATIWKKKAASCESSRQNIDNLINQVLNPAVLRSKPTGRTFTIVGNACPLTRITTTTEVSLRKPTALDNETSKPVVTLVYSRKPRKSITNVPVSKSKVFKIVLWYLDSGCSKHMTGDRSQLTNIVNKFLGTIKFGNDHVAKILGYGVDLLTGSRGNNLYTLSLGDMMASSPICLLSKASKTKSWLWHRRLSHLNFGAINHLARHGLVRGLPKLKFEKDHLCSACAMGKSKKKPHKPKSEDTNQEKLYLLHMDLCGPMRVASVNGKKYILVIVDDYSRFTWVKFLRSKDEAPDFIIKFLNMIQVRLKMTVQRIRTDNV